MPSENKIGLQVDHPWYEAEGIHMLAPCSVLLATGPSYFLRRTDCSCCSESHTSYSVVWYFIEVWKWKWQGDGDYNDGPVSVSRQILSVSTFLGLGRTIVKEISQRPRTLARQWETPVRSLREDPELHTRFGTPGKRWWRQDYGLAGVNSRRQFWCPYEPYVFIFSDTSVQHVLLECTMTRRLPMQNFIPLVATLTGGCKVNSGYQQSYEAFTIWKCS